MLLFYVRHGDPVYEPDGLTEQGYQQAKALVQRMKICNPQKIFASSSNRAILTAKPTADYLNKDIEILDWCNEGYAWQEFTTLKENGKRIWYFQDREYVELFSSDEIFKLGEEWWKHPKIKDTKAKSGILRIKKQTDDFMQQLGYERKGKGFVAKNPTYDRVALFAHQGFGIAFLSCLMDIPYPMFSSRFDLGHSSITVIELADSGVAIPRILQLSNDSHIFASQTLKTNYQNRIEF